MTCKACGKLIYPIIWISSLCAACFILSKKEIKKPIFLVDNKLLSKVKEGYK